MTDSSKDTGWMFQLFNEIGIIDQLVSAEFSRALGDDLNQSEFSVLNHFVRVGDGTSPSRLARIFQMTKPSMTAIIGKLDSKGYVSVEASETDRRQKIIRITPAGHEARNAGLKATRPLGKAWQSGMDQDALKAALPALTSLREFLDERRNHIDKLD